MVGDRGRSWTPSHRVTPPSFRSFPQPPLYLPVSTPPRTPVSLPFRRLLFHSLPPLRFPALPSDPLPPPSPPPSLVSPGAPSSPSSLPPPSLSFPLPLRTPPPTDTVGPSTKTRGQRTNDPRGRHVLDLGGGGGTAFGLPFSLRRCSTQSSRIPLSPFPDVGPSRPAR